MAKDVNMWVGTGRLGADPESRRVRGGDDLVVNIRIACDNSYKDRDGKEQGTTEWVPIVVFGHGADFVDKYLKKGDRVAVRGMFKTRSWEDQDGKKRYTTEIVVDNFNGQIVSMGQSGGGSSDRRDNRDGGRRDDRDRDDRRDNYRDRDDRGRDRDDRGRDRDDRRESRGGRDDRDDYRDRDRGSDRDDRSRGPDRDRDNGRTSDSVRDRDSRRNLDDDIPF